MVTLPPLPPIVRVHNLPANGGVPAAVLSGAGGFPPATNAMRVGTVYLNRGTWDLFELRQVNGEMRWELIGNIRGPAGDTTLSPEEMAALVANVADEVEADLEPPIDLVVLFENSLAG